MRDGEGVREDVTAGRPNPGARWICGYQPLGMGCHEGPSDEGICCQRRHVEASDNCAPEECERGCPTADRCKTAQQRRDLERYRDLGPCIPQKASWFSRQTLALNVAILVGGLLLLCMALPVREQVFVAGPLSQKHAQILGNTLVSQRCSLCHPSSHSGAGMTTTQDALCMKCHQAHMPAAVLQSPHDLQPEQLTLLTRSEPIETLLVATDDSSGENVAGGTTTCAMCHVEHHGPGRDIKAIADARCQACHKRKFASLANGHPQFDGYPYRTERRIAFNHAAHQGKHFAQHNEDFDCGQCHLDEGRKGRVGSLFRTLGFDEACARCHSQPIQSAATGGWAVMELPSITPEDVLVPELGLGDWPAGARFGYDGYVSPVLQWLLSTDPKAARAMALLPASRRISDMDFDQRADAARAIAQAIRTLVADVARQGQAAWTRRLTRVAEQSLNRPLDEDELSLVRELSAGLPPDLFRQIEQAWFENGSSLAVRQGSRQFQLASAPTTTDALENDASELAEATSAQPALEEASEEGLLADGTADIDRDAELIDGDHLLDETLSSEEDLLDNLAFGSAEPLTDEIPAGRILAALSGDEHVSQGGWYLDRATLAVRYMPRGHGDLTLAAWAEFAALMTHHQSPRPQTGQTDATDHGIAAVPGDCLGCHVFDKTTTPWSEWSAWRSVRRPATARTFTKFTHTPHLTLPGLSDCRYCHVLADDSKPEELATSIRLDYSSPNSDSVSPEFATMVRGQCVACHQQGGANDGCTHCHNYHISGEGFSSSLDR